jgi:hypothetical protein
MTHDFTPFSDLECFSFAHYEFVKRQSSAEDINTALHTWASRSLRMTGVDTSPFSNYDDMLKTIDSVKFGECSWGSFECGYMGPLDASSAPWMHDRFTVHTRDMLEVARVMLANPEFHGHFDYSARKDFTPASGEPERWERQFSDVMSGEWAWRESVSRSPPSMMHVTYGTLQVKVSKLPGTAGSMLVGVAGGLDKTTVSVGTGDVEFHPVYATLTNIKNGMRRAHREALVPIAFLAIPKSTSNIFTYVQALTESMSLIAFLAHAKTNTYLRFRKQLYHACLARIFEPLRMYMEQPDVARCPDGHFRRVIYSIGPWIADYPEQVWLSGVVQNWCPK